MALLAHELQVTPVFQHCFLSNPTSEKRDEEQKTKSEEQAIIPQLSSETLPSHVFRVVYGSDGRRLASNAPRRLLDLRPDQEVLITHGPYAGDSGVVMGQT